MRELELSFLFDLVRYAAEMQIIQPKLVQRRSGSGNVSILVTSVPLDQPRTPRSSARYRRIRRDRIRRR